MALADRWEGAGLRRPARTASHPPFLPPHCRGAGPESRAHCAQSSASARNPTGGGPLSSPATPPSTAGGCPPPPETLPSGAHLPGPLPPRAVSRRPHFRDPRAPPLPDVTSSRVQLGASPTAPPPRPGRPALWASACPRYLHSYAGGFRRHTRGRPFGPAHAGKAPPLTPPLP